MSLHPAGRGFFRSFSFSRVNWVMLALVIIAALPLLISASTNIELQASITDDHAAGGHYGFMAAFGFSVIGIGLLASLRPYGWRLTAWVGGLLAALLGLTSLVYPDITSSLPTRWAIAALAWGGAFITAAEYSKGPREPGAAQLTNGARQTAPGLPPSKSGGLRLNARRHLDEGCSGVSSVMSSVD